MHVDTDDLATLLKMQHLDLEALRVKKQLEELPQRAVILEARSKKKAIEQKRAQLDALHAKADAQLAHIDEEDASLAEKQRHVQGEIDAVRGDYRGVEARTKELNGFAKRRNTLEAELNTVSEELAKIEGVQAQVTAALAGLERQEAEATAAFVKQGGALKDAAARIEPSAPCWRPRCRRSCSTRTRKRRRAPAAWRWGACRARTAACAAWPSRAAVSSTCRARATWRPARNAAACSSWSSRQRAAERQKARASGLFQRRDCSSRAADESTITRARPCRPSCTSCRRSPCGHDPLCP
ncbi:hypothetical protein [Eggerthella sinensis]|uniref:zinc ribbon domain-containing protein n=1 Tax=Eggerthella sinensis TaxID=242230 RepID=UPI002FD7ED00